MKQWFFILVIITASVLLIFWGINKKSSGAVSFINISPTEVKAMLDEGEPIILIDVRSPAEFVGELGHIPGSMLRPLPEIDQWVTELNGKYEEKIVLVCRSGNRSGVSAKYLTKNGFKKVYNMSGGMKAWNKMGFPVEKETVEVQQ